MLLKLNKLAVFVILILSTVSSFASLLFDDIRKLPPFPDSFYELPFEKRVDWLEAKLDKDPSQAEKYRLIRYLFFELYYDNQIDKSRSVCNENQPLREDYYYREICLMATFLEFDELLPHMLELIHDAKQDEKNNVTAVLLTDLAWRQSQHGDIAGAYQSYETALALAPSDDVELLNTIMMDTATNYIVHGDDNYIEKGIALLAKVREQSKQELEKEQDPQKQFILKDSIELTNFNTGIAYTLHLLQYDKALSFFDRVNNLDGNYTLSALSFSSLAAAELGQFDRSRAYIKKVADKQDPSPIIDNYLVCYRQLAARHWDQTQSVKNCLKLDPETTVEVQLDVYKRLSEFNDPDIKLEGLQSLKRLFVNKLEPQLRGRGSQAASNTELQRLQRESDLKTVVLEQQEALQKERDATHASQQKLFIALMVILISFILLVASQLRQKKKLAEQYQRMSIRDSLTKLGNRRYLEQQIERELAYVRRVIQAQQQAALGIYIFDIDHFKSINDTYGHQAGDEVLLEMSRRISEATRDTDILVRWGGEEFVYVARLDNNERTFQLAERILTTINGRPFQISNYDPIKVTCTIGVVKYPFIDIEHIDLWTRLISLADAALYYGKMMHRNCWVVINNESIDNKEQIEDILSKPLQQAIEEKLVTVTSSFK